MIWLALIAGIVGAVGALLLKFSNKKKFHLGTSALAYVIALGILLLALRTSPVGIAYALTSIQYPTALFLGKYFLKEKITNLKIISTVLIIGGILLLAL